ncbi:MAG: DUF6455 family protein [Roseovarius sp.]|nr:DUF6455 family protein [Roseovarius sp.]
MTAILARLGDPNRAFWLTRSVARAIGVNLTDAMQQGEISAADYTAMVTRCRKCLHAEACEAWLAVNGAGAERAPAHCANADLLNALPVARRRVRL